MIKKIISMCLIFLCTCFASFNGFALNTSIKQAVPSQNQTIHLKYNNIADQFHILDQISGSLPDFFIIPAYKNEWVKLFGNTEQDILNFQKYKSIRNKYQNYPKMNVPISLFAPNPDSFKDPILNAFFTNTTIDEALEKLRFLLTKEEIKFLQYIFDIYTANVNKLRSNDVNEQWILDQLNPLLDTKSVRDHLSNISDFYHSKPIHLSSVVLLWGPESADFNGRCYGNHLMVILPFNKIKESDKTNIKRISSVIVHEASHNISGNAPDEQKVNLSNDFLNKAGEIDNNNYLFVLEEPLVMASQIIFVKNNYPDIFDKVDNWFNHPLAKPFSKYLETYLKDKKPIDTSFIEKCADEYNKSHELHNSPGLVTQRR